MKLIILGNGFDLASNLPTLYSNFFDYRIYQKKDIFDKINSFLEQPVKSKINTNQIPKVDDVIDKIQAIKNVKELSSDILSNNLNFWDIYFWWLYKNKRMINDYNWNDVEEEMRNFVSSLPTESNITLTKFDLNMSFDFNKNRWNGSSSSRDYENNIFINYSKNEKILIILNELLFSKKSSDKNDLHSLILDQLILFEYEFKEYISIIMSEIVFVDKKRKNRSIYFNNFFNVIDSSFETEYFLLNFNFTGFQNLNIKNDQSINEISNSIDFTRDKKARTITEVNVHGNFNKKVIFGVDQDEIKAIENYYIFTKTYRKASENKNLVTQPLPNRNSINEIIFFGHSLSNADYSYFQSIFDYYDLYESNIKLSFKYSYYNHESTHWKIKHKQINSAINLIKRYGNSMSNTKKGENLIHKLLLENRINFEDIKLDEIDTKSFREKYHIEN